jgi:hypothetical protein
MRAMDTIRDAVTSASRYVVQNPGMIARMLAHAIAFRLPIPLDAIKWLADNLANAPGSPPVTIDSAPPGLQLQGSIAIMGNTMQASAIVNVTEIQLSPDVFNVTVVVADLALEAENSASPLAQLLKSGALDLTRPADLLKFMGKTPAVIADAHVDTFKLDLLKVPEVAQNDGIRRALNAFTPVVTVREIFSQDDLLLVAFQANPSGLPNTLSAVREFLQGS